VRYSSGQVAGAARGAQRTGGTVVRAELDHGRAELVAARDRPLEWTLLVDGTAQSHVDLADPVHLEFEYVRRIGHLLDALDPPPPEPLAVLHLGGGAWTLPRYVAATRPRATQRVVELDGALPLRDGEKDSLAVRAEREQPVEAAGVEEVGDRAEAVLVEGGAALGERRHGGGESSVQHARHLNDR